MQANQGPGVYVSVPRLLPGEKVGPASFGVGHAVP
jgi:hypothetical protein